MNYIEMKQKLIYRLGLDEYEIEQFDRLIANLSEGLHQTFAVSADTLTKKGLCRFVLYAQGNGVSPETICKAILDN